MKKIINKLILIFLILNILIITLIFVFARKKTQKIKISEDNLVKEMTISYKVHGNPLPKVEVQDLSNKDALINTCAGSLGQSFNISGNLEISTIFKSNFIPVSSERSFNSLATSSAVTTVLLNFSSVPSNT